ncbi:PepSY domain-containing protein [Niallia sp. Krafla_26]|uniref:PepSY domain-containing protein n=1 Tax=Niallia sp. Krafla_26 TaxID=3064703 RepID=UPI003D16E5A2
MKKKILISTFGAAIIFGGAFAVGASNLDDNNKMVKDLNRQEMLSATDAEKIALQEVDGVVEEIELEKEKNRLVYEMDIDKDGVDYNLYLDAYTGEVYSVNRDDHDDDFNSNPTSRNMISQSEAIAIAENAVNGKMKEIDRDEDDGFYKYEVELRTDRGEVEVEIDAVTGKILEVEMDD